MILGTLELANKLNYDETREEIEYILLEEPEAFKNAINELDILKLEKLTLRHSVTQSKNYFFAYLLYMIANINIYSATEFLQKMEDNFDLMVVNELHIDAVNLQNPNIDYFRCKIDTVYIDLDNQSTLEHIVTQYKDCKTTMLVYCKINEVIIKYEEENQIDISIETFKNLIFEVDKTEVEEIKLIKI